MTGDEWERALGAVVPDHVEVTPEAVAEYVRTLRERLAFIGMILGDGLDDTAPTPGPQGLPAIGSKVWTWDEWCAYSSMLGGGAVRVPEGVRIIPPGDPEDRRPT